ncbi:MazG-like family protein [Halobacteria archaeon AArc-curdl1]|uniref:MazG-like family protein n=1 Tax=Natronosalvus hydrolyticus TaxID=2979988 RepID=A0AAP2ZBI0_9EURY|nr:MazG-like family protein [Halobacteria archaeon AArc-curdl1]
MDDQQRVAAFLETYDLHTDPAYRTLDLVSEVGEVTKEINGSTDYGSDPDEVTIARDELGDVYFALLSLCTELNVDASSVLEESLSKYERRLERKDTPGSEESNPDQG